MSTMQEKSIGNKETIEVEQIRDIRRREFGFMFVKGQKYNAERDVTEDITRFERGIEFSSIEEVRMFIKTKRPSDCFFSTGYFTFPYLAPSKHSFHAGSDLFFDMDSDNLKLAYADAITIYTGLQEDFGIDDLEMIFSGAKGYHVVAYGWKDNARLTQKLREMDSNDRKEMLSYFYDGMNCKTIDPVVTGDLHRLRRIAGTTNSKSGKICKIIKTTN